MDKIGSEYEFYEKQNYFQFEFIKVILFWWEIILAMMVFPIQFQILDHNSFFSFLDILSTLILSTLILYHFASFLMFKIFYIVEAR